MELKYYIGFLLILLVSGALFIDYNKNLIDFNDVMSVVAIYTFILFGILVIV